MLAFAGIQPKAFVSFFIVETMNIHIETTRSTEPTAKMNIIFVYLSQILFVRWRMTLAGHKLRLPSDRPSSMAMQ